MKHTCVAVDTDDGWRCDVCERVMEMPRQTTYGVGIMFAIRGDRGRISSHIRNGFIVDDNNRPIHPIIKLPAIDGLTHEDQKPTINDAVMTVERFCVLHCVRCHEPIANYSTFCDSCAPAARLKEISLE